MSTTQNIDLDGGGIPFPVRVYPATAPTGAVLVWLHGGAFMFGDLDMPEADQVGVELSARGITVVSVDYALAPLDALVALAPPDPGADVLSPDQLRAMTAGQVRARFPVASLQTVAAFDWAVAHAAEYGGDPARVGLGGASAGGNLAAGAALRLRDRATDLPALVALVYPVLHDPLPEADADLLAALEGLPIAQTFPRESTIAINANYLGDDPDPHGYAFPGGHDLRGYPPTLIVNADRDRLRASGEAFAAELATAGVDVHVLRVPGTLHGFLDDRGGDDALRLIDRIARAL